MSIAACASNTLELMNRRAGDVRNSPDQSPQLRDAAGGAHLDHHPYRGVEDVDAEGE